MENREWFDVITENEKNYKSEAIDALKGIGEGKWVAMELAPNGYAEVHTYDHDCISAVDGNNFLLAVFQNMEDFEDELRDAKHNLRECE